jgi:hypothetical protein
MRDVMHRDIIIGPSFDSSSSMTCRKTYSWEETLYKTLRPECDWHNQAFIYWGDPTIHDIYF